MPQTGTQPQDFLPLLPLAEPATHRQGALLKAGALQAAILSSGNFSSIATDERGVIQIFNVGAQRMLGYEPAEVLNRITPADLCDLAELAQRALSLSAEFCTSVGPDFEAMVFKAARGIEDSYELSHLRRDGTRLPMLVSVSALRDTHEQLIGYLFIGTDNTARKHMEAERAQLAAVLQCAHCDLQAAKAEADRANQAKSDFLSGMSHELRSPLNAILGFAQLLEGGTPVLTIAQGESVGQILQAGWYLLELINEVLDLAMIESGRLSMSPESVSLAELLADCEAMVGPQARENGIALKLLPPAQPLYVQADRTRAKQVVINLLINAIKYNRVGGSVTLGWYAAPHQRVRLSVRDTGLGLAANKLSALFEPFNRLGQEGGAMEGTGIGLVVCQRLTTLMGGLIGVNSEVGVGSTFWVELPACSAPELEVLLPPALPALARDNTPNPVRHTVLCVEDNPANLLLVQRLLAPRADIRLISASDGRSGVELARSAQPDVVLMDINLPGISGLTALRLLAADAATAHIPVMALSANAMPRDIDKGLQAGFFRYLTKPIRVEGFLQALDSALAYADQRRLQASQPRPEHAKDTSAP